MTPEPQVGETWEYTWRGGSSQILVLKQLRSIAYQLTYIKENRQRPVSIHMFRVVCLHDSSGVVKPGEVYEQAIDRSWSKVA